MVSTVIGKGGAMCCKGNKKTGVLDEDLNFLTLTEDKPVLINNDKWYIKHAGARTVVACRIMSTTEHTVKINELADIATTWSRYKKVDIDFVEKMK